MGNGYAIEGVPYAGRLAVLSVRLHLDFNPAGVSARQFQNEMVWNHLRVAFKPSRDVDYMISGTPTEPILANAAAEFMELADPRGGYLTFGALRGRFDLLDDLIEYVERGFAPRHGRGALVGRLLDILALDNARPRNIARGTLLYHSVPIPVLDYLRCLLPDSRYHAVLQQLPANGSRISPTQRAIPLEQAFKNAYLHTTHYVRAGDDAILGTEFLWAVWARGCAFLLGRENRICTRALPIHWTTLKGTGVQADDGGVQTAADMEYAISSPDPPYGHRDKREIRVPLSRHLCSVILHIDVDNQLGIAFPLRPEPFNVFKEGVTPKPVLAMYHLYRNASRAAPCDVDEEETTYPSFSEAPAYEILFHLLTTETYGVIDKAMEVRISKLLDEEVIDETACSHMMPDGTSWFEN